MKSTNTPNNEKIHIGAWCNYQPNEIMLLLGCVNYTKIFLTNGRCLTVATTLKVLESRFASCGSFFRTHKSFLINLNYIKNRDSLKSDEFVEMQNNYRVAVSRRKKLAFQNRINLNQIN
jgi:DNA-binding LytR/AlgR family response regulator